MKTLKRLEIIAILTFIAIIIFASFFGVYKKEDFRTVNIIKEYDLGMELTDTISLELTVSEDENEVIYDKEGNIITDDGETEYTEENGYKIEKVKVNKEESLTKDNYILSKKILKNRLKGMGVGEYKIILDEENGNISVELKEDDNAEEILYYLKQQGEFTIIDKETQEVLMDNSDVKSAKVVYGAGDETGTTTIIYLQVDFNKEGTKKLEEISQIYVAGEEHVHNEETEEEHTHDEESAKYISVVLDGATLSSTYFGEKMSTGVLYIPVTEAADSNVIAQYVEELNNIVTVINNGELPIVYEYSEETIELQVNKNLVLIAALATLIIFLVAGLILVIKFHTKGFVATYLQIGYIALLLLVLRYTNVVITIEGIVGVLISVVINYILVYIMLNSLKKKEEIEWTVIKKFVIRTSLIYVIAIILAFNSLTKVNSLGMALVWGSFIIYLYNLTITRKVLKMLNK